jgi:hypothetical protein
MNMLTFKQMMTLLAAILFTVTASAQTDYTSRITNPSFEQGTDGWEHKGMSAQGNSVFDIKSGSTYMERWTGRGGAVGSGKLSQVIYDLPAGNYELTAAAQNIQEDTPTAAQTGAWIFAENSPLFTLSSSLHKTTVTVRNTYKVAFNFVSGSVTIGNESAPVDISDTMRQNDNGERNMDKLYDLQGRKLTTIHSPLSTQHDVPLKKGVYIVNGKKVVVR